MFYASYFTYDDIPSANYGLQIASFDASNPETTTVFAPTFNTVKSSRQRNFSHAGVLFEEPPEFSFQIIRDSEITEMERRGILRWLLGRNSFKPLIIHQEDLEEYTYNCVFSAVDMIYVNGHLVGFDVTATFDSWFARGADVTVTYTGDGSAAEEVDIVNNSDVYEDYVYPSIELTNISSYATVSGNAYNLSIINTTDSESRETVFYNLDSNETVELDGETRAIYNEYDNGRLDCFNKVWLRLLPGKNTLSIQTNGKVTITCPTYALIGF